MRDYLTRNVVEQLPVELREFLVETSVLGRLNAELCDQLLERTGSGETLAELERRNLFTQALPEEGAYRYHEVLRSYLQGALLQDLGEGRLRDRFRRAGQLLAAAEALPEALEAFCRAEDWKSAQALLGRDGAQAAVSSSAWLDVMPATVLLHDPWLLLASARRLRAEGRLADATERYQRAEAAFAGTDPAEICRAERRALGNWLDAPAGPPRSDWSGLLRQAITREPMSAARDAGDTGTPAGRLVAGLARLLAGEVAHAEQELLALAEDDETDAMVGISAAMGAGIAQLVGGKARGVAEVDGAVAASERLGFDWLARLGRSSLAIGGGAEARREALTVAVACAAAGDRWGAALARLFAAWGAVNASDTPDDMDSLLAELRALRAPVLEAWGFGLRAVAMARTGEPDAQQAALQAEAMARSAGVPAARLFSYLALAAASTTDAPEYLEQAHAMGAESGIALPAAPADRLEAAPASVLAGNGHAPAPPIRIRLLGGYGLQVDGVPVDLTAVRPRVRSLLRLLSLHAGAPIHHEQIEAALWPEADSLSASRNLHVAVAALRRALEPTAGRGGFQLVRRIGDAYVLSLPMGAEVDLLQLEMDLAAARAARARTEIEPARRAFRAVLDEYRGELLPEEGPAEWVTDRRETARLAAVEAAQALAEMLLADGEAEAAASVCAAGLRVERYHDPLWRLLIRARDQAGDQGAATRARHGYGRMLAELGVESGPPSFSGAP
jgi:DNA-binding SARP family transcriptional activator